VSTEIICWIAGCISNNSLARLALSNGFFAGIPCAQHDQDGTNGKVADCANFIRRGAMDVCCKHPKCDLCVKPKDHLKDLYVRECDFAVVADVRKHLTVSIMFKGTTPKSWRKNLSAAVE
jgi:hypothetical protein